MSDTVEEPDTDKNAPESQRDSGKMSFLEHLDELRKRLLHIAIYIAIGFLACWWKHKQIYDFLALPLTKLLEPGTKLVFTNITDTFSLYMKVSMLAGLFLTLPFSLYEVWKFIAPGLYRKEKRYVIPFLVSSMILFLSGAAFCYLIILPTAFKFFLDLGSSFTPVIKVDEYFDLTNMMLLGFGLIFEMPVIIGFLSLFGLVTASFLWRKFKYAIVAIVVLAAVISPTGDAFNLMVWSAPMILLYIISIGVAALFGWRRKKQAAAGNQ
jgi:sec-independent protein translocase protein TatC